MFWKGLFNPSRADRPCIWPPRSDQEIKQMTRFLSRFLNDDSGATAIEYGLIAALIAAVIVTAVSSVGTSLLATFTSVAGSLAPTTH
jgi:pilus assembly protein Flp/PilA